MKLVIDRDKWLRGRHMGWLLKPLLKPATGVLEDDSQDAGKMCCLGFLALQCGFKKNNIRNKTSFMELRGQHPKLSKQLPTELQAIEDNSCIDIPKSDTDHWDDPDFAQKLMHLNDSGLISDKMREYRLRRNFKSIGIDVEFIN